MKKLDQQYKERIRNAGELDFIVFKKRHPKNLYGIMVTDVLIHCRSFHYTIAKALKQIRVAIIVPLSSLANKNMFRSSRSCGIQIHINLSSRIDCKKCSSDAIGLFSKTCLTYVQNFICFLRYYHVTISGTLVLRGCEIRPD